MSGDVIKIPISASKRDPIIVRQFWEAIRWAHPASRPRHLSPEEKTYLQRGREPRIGNLSRECLPFRLQVEIS